MNARILRKGEKIDFPTHTIGTKTRLFIKNRSRMREGQARVKVGWTPAETVEIDPGKTTLIERDWAGVEGNIFNMGLNDIEVWVS